MSPGVLVRHPEHATLGFRILHSIAKKINPILINKTRSNPRYKNPQQQRTHNKQPPSRQTCHCLRTDDATSRVTKTRHNNNNRADDKRGIPPLTLTNRGTLPFAGGEVFDIHVGINPPAQFFHGTQFFTYISTVSEQPNAQRSVVRALSSPKSQTLWHPVRKNSGRFGGVQGARQTLQHFDLESI